jgi:hypothetical protein
MIVRPAVAFRASASAPARAIAKVRGLSDVPPPFIAPMA